INADSINPVTSSHILLEVKLGADPRKIKVIPNGVDTKRFSNGEKEQDKKELIVGTVARLNPIKDVKTLIRAAKIVTDTKSNVIFEFYGPTEDNEYKNQAVELIEDLSLEGKFIFKPETKAPEKVYTNFSVFALSSISEAQPLAILEAMSSGVPVVASRVGGVPEPVEGSGLLFNPGDFKQMAKSILFFVDKPKEKYKASILSREKILKFFSERDFIESYRKLYNTFK
ncbi:MAG: GT4 family glycosyltransferase PelF, partial [Candidatus Odinarchaeia archaeon]